MFSFTRFGEYVRFAWDALKANKIRSFLTTLGILIGVTTIILIFTIIQSISQYVEGEFAGLGSTTIYVSKFPWIITGNFWEFRNRPPVTLEEYEAIRQHSKLARWISPLLESMRTVEYRNKSLEEVYTVGVAVDYSETNNVDIELGRWLTSLEVENGRYVCIIGQTVRDELFGKENPLGKRIKINGFPYQVIGVLEKKGNFFGFNMDNQVIIPYTTFRGAVFHRRSISIAIRVADARDLEDLIDEVRGIMRRVRKLPPREKDNFAINQQDMLTDFYRQVTSTSYLVIFIVGAISLLVGGIGIMNIMLVSVNERIKEIGIRKAVGATRKQIMLHFLTESVMVSSVGGILGMILGVLVSSFPLKFLQLQASVSLWTVMIGFGFSAFVGIVSGLYPANKAANLNPIEALRYE